MTREWHARFDKRVVCGVDMRVACGVDMRVACGVDKRVAFIHELISVIFVLVIIGWFLPADFLIKNWLVKSEYYCDSYRNVSMME